MKNQKNVAQASSLSSNVAQASSLSSNVKQASSLLKKHRQDTCSTLIKAITLIAISAICTVHSFADSAENILRDSQDITKNTNAKKLYSVLRYAEATENAEVAKKVLDIYLKQKPTSVFNAESIERGQLAAELYRHTQNTKVEKDIYNVTDAYLRPIKTDKVYRYSRYWAEDTFFITVLQIQAYKATGNKQHLDFAITNMLGYVEKLEREAKQGFNRSEGFGLSDAQTNGYVATALAEVVSTMEPTHPDYKTLLDSYHGIITPALQCASLDDTGKGLVIHAIAKNVHPPEKKRCIECVLDFPYRNAVLSLWKQLIVNVENGRMTRACQLTQPPIKKLRKGGFPNHISESLEGQCALLLAVTSILDYLPEDKQNEARNIGKKASEFTLNFMGRFPKKNMLLPEFMAYYGILSFATKVNDTQIIDKVKANFEPYRNGTKHIAHGNLEYDTIGIIASQLYLLTKDDSYKRIIELTAVKQMRANYDNTRKVDVPQEKLTDTVVAFARMYIANPKEKVLEFAVQLCLSDEIKKETISNQTYAISEVLNVISSTHSSYKQLLDLYKNLAEKCLNETNDNGITAIAYGVTNGYLTDVKFVNFANNKSDNLIANSAVINMNKTLDAKKNVSAKFETSVSDTPNALRVENMLELAQKNDLKKLKVYCLALQKGNGFFKQSSDLPSSEWSRASAIAASALNDVLLTLNDKNSADYAFFRASFKKLAFALERTQDIDGLWHLIPDNGNSKVDTGASASFICALANALTNQWLYRLEFRDMVILGAQGLAKYTENGKLENACITTSPKKSQLYYFNVPQVTGDAYAQYQLNRANIAIDNYKKSSIPNSKEDLDKVMGPLADKVAEFYKESLPDGRLLRHVSLTGIVRSPYPYLGLKKYKAKRHIDTRYGKNVYYGHVKGKIFDRSIEIPESVKKQPYPMGGVCIWLKDNPSVYTVTDDLGFWFLNTPFAIISNQKATEDVIVMTQIRGQEPLERIIKLSAVAKCGNPSALFAGYYVYSGFSRDDVSKFVTTPYKGTKENLPTGPSDMFDHYQLSETLLKHHQKERKDLLAMLNSNPKIQILSDGKELRPIYLRGNVISAKDNKPLFEASVWVKRNPFLIDRSNHNGEIEIMMKEAMLYLHEKDSLMVTAAGYKPLEISLKSYLDDKIKIVMQPRIVEIVSDSTIPMIRVPSGFFRMGKGLTATRKHNRNPSGEDGKSFNCWPIQTIYQPSYYLAQYQIDNRLHREMYLWGLKNGYKSQYEVGFLFPMFCNALSEKEGLTPCYYTADLKVIRDHEQITEKMICNWNADGYRIPTIAEFRYAQYGGKTGPFFTGGSADEWSKSIYTPLDVAYEGIRNTFYPGRRAGVGFGVYDWIVGLCNPDHLWDFQCWRADDGFAPKGPTFREGREFNRKCWGARFLAGRFRVYNYDTYESQWCNDWDANPIGFSHGGWKNDSAESCPLFRGAFWPATRLVRNAENICNDINMLRKRYDDVANLANPVDKNTITEKIDMIDITGGTYIMGSAGWGKRKGSQGHPMFNRIACYPERTETVKDFQIAKYETTMQQWESVRNWGLKNGYTDISKGDMEIASSDDKRHPVTNINWNDVIKWCNAASEMNGLKPCYYTDSNMKTIYKAETVTEPICDWSANGYRLATEAEWEYAGRAGTNSAFYWGDARYLFSYCWMGGKNRGGGECGIYGDDGIPGSNSGGFTHIVGQKKANQFGLYDMVGNVWEWVWDWTAPYNMMIDAGGMPYGPKSKQEVLDYIKNNKTKSNVTGCPSKNYAKRCVKGQDCLAQYRRWGADGVHQRGSIKADFIYNTIGFRVARGK